MNPNKDIVTSRDVIRAGGCVDGLRTWFESNGDIFPGVTLRHFLKNGIPLADVKREAHKCGYLRRIVELKEKEHGR